MEYQLARSVIERLSKRFNLLVLFSVILLISNIILSAISFWAFYWANHHVKHLVIPPVVSSSFYLSENQFDASYLRQMGLFFIYERLNVTPETVKAQHKILEDYLESGYYHAFVKILNNEAQAIKSNKISSVFYPIALHVYPDKNALMIQGKLKRWVFERALKPVLKTYVIQFKNDAGMLRIHSFKELLK